MARRIIQPVASHDLELCAPLFAAAVRNAIADCNAAGWDARVFEALRSDELQQFYFANGTSNAQHVWKSWHGYGLAVDVVSRQHGWDLWGRSIPTAWQVATVQIFKKHGLAWGGDWLGGVGASHAVDWDHFQWGRCKKSPSIISVELYQASAIGYQKVWPIVEAI